MTIYAVVNKHLMDIPVKAVLRFEKEFGRFMDESYPTVGKEIKTTGELSKATEEQLVEAIGKFKKIFDINED